MREPIAKLRQVNKTYWSGRVENHVLQDVDLTLQAGDFLAIVGTSGSGKSTLLNLIGGLDRGYSGLVQVTGLDLARLSDRELSHFRNEKVGFIFQQFNLLDHLSCAENVAMPGIFARTPPQDAHERAVATLARVGMADRSGDLPANLSGGQKQRIAIARALFNQPALLLCDEATGNLDTKTGQQIIDLFSSLNRDDGITVIIVTHEARVSGAAQRVVRLEDGRVLMTEGGDVGVAVTGSAEA